MSNTLIQSKSYVQVGLGTVTFTIPTTTTWNVQYELTENPPSSIAVIVQKNGGTIFTAPVLGGTQGAMKFKVSFLAAATDVITVVSSSGAAIDNAYNTVKSIISIDQGL